MEEVASAELDRAVRGSLTSLHGELPPDWFGREREVVSHFCFGYLPRFFRPDNRMLRDQAQIGIEVAVKQTNHTGEKVRKRVVCKDVVIWPPQFTTVWDNKGRTVNTPLCVLEWKCITHSNKRRVNPETILKHDTDWLKEFTLQNRGCVGFAVFADLTSRPVVIKCARFESGDVKEDWLALPGGKSG